MRHNPSPDLPPFGRPISDTQSSQSSSPLRKAVIRRSPFVIFVLALIVTLSITWGVFEAMPHIEDEFANYFQAQVFASGRLWLPSPSQPGSFLVPFAVDLDGRRFSKYPPGFAAVLALGVLSGAHWLVNPLLGALTLLVLYAIGQNLFNAETGLLAAMLGLLSPMFLGLSSTLLPHSLSTLCLLTFTWAYLRISNFKSKISDYRLSPRPLSVQPPTSDLQPLISNLQSPIPNILLLLLGGVALGWAALTRPYSALAYALPFALLAGWRIIRTRRWSLLGAFALMGLVTAGVAALLPLYGHTLTGQYTVDLYTLVWPYDRIGFGPGHGVLPGGHTLKIAVLDAAVDLQDLLTVLLGWPYLSWLPVLVGLALPPRRRLEPALLAPFVAIVIAQGAYWIQGSSLYGPRYYYEALPLVWLLAARGLQKLWRVLQTSKVLRNTPERSGVGKNLRGLVIVRLALAILIGINVLGVMPPRFDMWRGLYGVTRQPRQQIAQLNLHNALIFVHIHHWGDYSELAWTNNLSLDSDLVFALDEGPAANDAVIAQYPGRRVFYLDGHTLMEVENKK